MRKPPMSDCGLQHLSEGDDLIVKRAVQVAWVCRSPCPRGMSFDASDILVPCRRLRWKLLTGQKKEEGGHEGGCRDLQPNGDCVGLR